MTELKQPFRLVYPESVSFRLPTDKAMWMMSVLEPSGSPVNGGSSASRVMSAVGLGQGKVVPMPAGRQQVRRMTTSFPPPTNISAFS